MDVTNFIASAGAFSAAADENLSREGVGKSVQRNSRLGLHKEIRSRKHLTDRRLKAESLHERRKINRFQDGIQTRGVVISGVEMSEEEDDSVQAPRKPLLPQQAKHSNRPDRRAQLEEFKKKRELQRLEEAKNKKPPFKVGVWRLEYAKVNVENFNFAGNQKPVFGANESHAMSTRSSSRLISTTRNKQLSSKPASLRPQLRSAAIRRNNKSQPKMSSLNTESTSEPVVDSEGAHDAIALSASPTLQRVTEVEDEQLAPAVTEAQSVESEDHSNGEATTAASLTDSGDKFDKRIEHDDSPNPAGEPSISCETKSGTPKSSDPQMSEATSNLTPQMSNIKFSEAIFKTPIGNTPMSRKRGRSSMRRTGAGMLLDSLRHDICSERGSSSDRKRRGLGLPLARPQSEILGLDKIISQLESGSPVEELLKEEESKVSSHDQEETVPAQPKNLDQEFQDIEDEKNEDKKSDVEPPPPTKVDDSSSVADVEMEACDTKDVAYFRNILKREMDRLEEKCKQWETKLSPDLGDEITEQVLSVIGFARLGMARKGRFSQFGDLIDDCEFNRGAQKTTLQDLEGFWDMIYIQIEGIDKRFEELSSLESNNWQKVEAEPKKAARNNLGKKVIARPKKPVASSGIRAKILAARKAKALGDDAKPVAVADRTTPVRKSNTLAPEKTPDCVTGTTTPSRSFGIGTPTTRGKSINPRISEIMLSTSKRRRSSMVGNPSCEETSHTEMSPEVQLSTLNTGVPTVEVTCVDTEGGEGALLKSGRKKKARKSLALLTPNYTPGKSPSTPRTRKSTRKSVRVAFAPEASDNESTTPVHSKFRATPGRALKRSLGTSELNHALSPGQEMLSEAPTSEKKIKFDDEVAAKPPRASMIPDLISFDSPVSKVTNSGKKTPRRKSILPDSGQLTPRRSSRLSVLRHNELL